jgi:hypothetical protein
MPLVGPAAWAVWIVLYGIPVGLLYLYLRKVEYRGGPWQVVHVLIILLLGAGCGATGYWVRHTFVVAPYLGYTLAGLIALASVPVVRGKWRELFGLSDQRRQSKPCVHCELGISPEEAQHGTRKILHRNNKKLEVAVPAGVTGGTLVRLSNALKITDGYPGDILVRIVIRE